MDFKQLLVAWVRSEGFSWSLHRVLSCSLTEVSWWVCSKQAVIIGRYLRGNWNFHMLTPSCFTTPAMKSSSEPVSTCQRTLNPRWSLSEVAVSKCINIRGAHVLILLCTKEQRWMWTWAMTCKDDVNWTVDPKSYPDRKKSHKPEQNCACLVRRMSKAKDPKLQCYLKKTFSVLPSVQHPSSCESLSW